MSRHRNVRSMNYTDEYDGYDDVYGHSVEDDYCISPSDASFMYDRSRQQPAQISNFLAEEDDIAEEDENIEPDSCLDRRDSSTYKRPLLNELDEARLQSCLDEVHSVVGDSFAENILIDTIVNCQFDLAKALDTILRTQSSKEETPKPQRVRRPRTGERDESNTYFNKLVLSKLNCKHKIPSGVKFVSERTADKNIHKRERLSGNKFSGINGYFHTHAPVNGVKNYYKYTNKNQNNFEVQDKIHINRKLNSPTLLTQTSDNRRGTVPRPVREETLKKDHYHHKFNNMENINESMGSKSTLVNELSPSFRGKGNIIKPTNLLESGLEIESVNCAGNSNSLGFSSFSSLTALAEKHKTLQENGQIFSRNDMVSSLFGENSAEVDKFYKRPNSGSDDQEVVKDIIIKRPMTGESVNMMNNRVPFSNHKYSQSIDSDDDEPFSLAQLAAKHEKSTLEQDHMLTLDDLASKHFTNDNTCTDPSSDSEDISLNALASRYLSKPNSSQMSLTDLASKHFMNDKTSVEPLSDSDNISLDTLASKHLRKSNSNQMCITDLVSHVPLDSEDVSLDTLASRHLSKSNTDDFTFITDLTSCHLSISSKDEIASSSMNFQGSPFYAPQFDYSNVPRIDNKDMFGNQKPLSDNICINPGVPTGNISKTVIGSPSLGINNFSHSTSSPKNILGAFRSNKSDSFTRSTISPLRDTLSLKSSVSNQSTNLYSESPEYISAGSSYGSSTFNFQNERQRTTSSNSQDQDIFDDDMCFFEPTINLSSALLPPTSGKKSEHNVLDSNWTKELNSALSPLNKDWNAPTEVERCEECVFDVKPILQIKLPLRTKKCSTFGKIICKKLKKPFITPFEEEILVNPDIKPFTFDQPSPDDAILKHLNRRK